VKAGQLVSRRWIVAFVVASVLAAIAATNVLAQDGAPAPATTVERKPIRGRVVDENGRPVDGALVSAMLYGASGNFAGTASGTSNREGEFTIPDLDPGLYSLWVQSPPFVVVEGIPDRGASPGQSLTIRMARGAAISGKVVDKDGQPLTGLHVEPIRVRDDEGHRLDDESTEFRGGVTDDRGEYRLWGLESGTYLLAVGHTEKYANEPRFLSDRVRTFYPSSNRAGATEVTVRAGDDIANADIAFRGEAGFRISGAVIGVPGRKLSPWTRVELYQAGMSSPDRSATMQFKGDASTFRFEALEDGEYQLVATSWDRDDQDTSERVTVRVRSADVTGVRLELQPTSTLTGRIEARAPKPDEACQAAADGKALPPLRLGEMAVRARRVDAKFYRAWTVRPKSDGEFTVKGLGGSVYRFALDLGDDDAFIERLDRPAAPPATPAKGVASAQAASKNEGPSLLARDGLSVTRGQSVSGVRFVVARGAARVRGRIVPAKEGDPLPARARVCLVPADAKQKDDVIHYYEVLVERDGTFDVRNVAPGEYFVATRTFPGDDRPDLEIFPAAWDPKERAALRAAAERLGIRVTLSPCQRLESAVITMTPPQ
jgi:protocatechuate 3,4-dioxygenase beta subunit